MALVRCPKHNIPYDNANPRGCPACARDRGGDDQAAIMAELARASRRVEVMPDLSPPEPEVVIEEPEPIARWRRPFMLYGVPIVLLLLFLLVRFTGPRFIDRPHPAPFAGQVLPLPLFPGQPVTVLFAHLGAQPPRSHPTAANIERYQYGTDLIIDAINGVVYSIQLRVPNRNWQGLRVGMSETETRGALALLGTVRDEGAATLTPDQIAGYQVFPSLAARPSRVFSARVRPPNGCYDVRVTLQPRVIGVVVDGGQRYVAVGRRNDVPLWVGTEVQVVSRSVAGPDAGGPVC